MDSKATRTPGSSKLKRDLSREAVDLAQQGEWQRSTEVNKAILELFPEDVEAMNRLVKALIELGSYLDARAVLNQVCEVAPYNSIAKKNRARLDHLAADPTFANPGVSKQTKKTSGATQIFIEESGKSGTTVLRNTRGNKAAVHVSPSDQVALSRDKNTVMVRTLDGQLLGQVEPRMGNRLARLMDGGNRYAAAVVTVNDGISIIIRETFKHSSLQNVCSFPAKAQSKFQSKSRVDDPVFQDETAARFVREEDEDERVENEPDEDDDEENIIDEDEMDTGWSEDE